MESSQAEEGVIVVYTKQNTAYIIELNAKIVVPELYFNLRLGSGLLVVGAGEGSVGLGWWVVAVGSGVLVGTGTPVGIGGLLSATNTVDTSTNNKPNILVLKLK